MISEGYPLPTKLPLTKLEEKNLKKIRRKIKNKVWNSFISSNRHDYISFSLHPIKTHRWFLELHFMNFAAFSSPPSCRLLELPILFSLFSYCSFPFNQFYWDKFLKSEAGVTITKKFQLSFNLSCQQSFSWSQYSILFCYTFLI